MLLVASHARAAEESEYARTGPYIGVGLVWAPSVFDVGGAEAAIPPASQKLSRSISTSNQFGLDARIGYRFHPHLAAEADYQWIPGFDLDRQNVGNVASVDTLAFTVNGKVFLTTDRLQPYFVGGVGLLHANTSPRVSGFDGNGSAFAGRAGVGADYYVLSNFVLNVEFSAVLPTSNVGDVRFLPLVAGAQYRF